MIRGVDVSHYNGAVDWSGLKARHSLSFGAAKAGEGISFIDSQFTRNWAGMKAAGLYRIAYWYATPSASTARVQAAKMVALVNPQPGDALCLDLEKSSLNQAGTNAWMRAFGDALHDLAPGIVTIAYLGGYAANGSGIQAVDHFDHWWYPRYATTGPAVSWPTSSTHFPTPTPNTTGFKAPRCPSLWQWTPNLSGMDANVSNLTVSQLFNTTTGGLTVADVTDILKAIAGLPHDVWAYDQPDASGHGTKPQAWSFQQIVPPTADAIAAAVIAKLPPSQTGGITKQDVVDALTQVLVNGTGGTA